MGHSRRLKPSKFPIGRGRLPRYANDRHRLSHGGWASLGGEVSSEPTGMRFLQRLRTRSCRLIGKQRLLLDKALDVLLADGT